MGRCDANPFDTPQRSAFRQSVSRFVENEITPCADAWDEAGAIPSDLHRKAGALGMFGFGISQAYGGLGFDDCFMRAAASEELGKCGATGVGAALGARNISTGPIAALGSEELKRRVDRWAWSPDGHVDRPTKESTGKRKSVTS